MPERSPKGSVYHTYRFVYEPIGATAGDYTIKFMRPYTNRSGCRQGNIRDRRQGLALGVRRRYTGPRLKAALQKLGLESSCTVCVGAVVASTDVTVLSRDVQRRSRGGGTKNKGWKGAPCDYSSRNRVDARESNTSVAPAHSAVCISKRKHVHIAKHRISRVPKSAREAWRKECSFYRPSIRSHFAFRARICGQSVNHCPRACAG